MSAPPGTVLPPPAAGRDEPAPTARRWPCLVPRTLAGRVTLTLTLGLAAVLLAAGLAAFLPYAEDSPRQRVAALAARLDAVVAAVAATPSAERQELLLRMDSGPHHFLWSPVAPPLPPQHHQSPRRSWLEGALATRLGQRADGVWLVGPPHRAPTVLVRLVDGSWLISDLADPGPDWDPLLRGLLLLVILGGGIGLLAVHTARRAVRPLARFAAAAERFGADVAAAPLPVEGADEIARAALAFNGMQARIREFLDERMTMLAAVSHDLRTPVTRLRLRLEQVEDEALRLRALADLAEMQALLDQLLGFARSERAETPTLTDVAALVRALAEDAADLGQAVRLVAAPDRLVLRCRPLGLRRAIGNLIDNALRYAGEAEVALAAPAGAPVVISVADRGPGIPAQRRAEAQRPFVRLEGSRNRSTGGVGLGLAIARAVAEAQGGRLELDDRPGGGLIARLVIPAA